VKNKSCPFCGSFEVKFKNHKDGCFLKAFEYCSQPNQKTKSTFDKDEFNEMWNNREGDIMNTEKELGKLACQYPYTLHDIKQVYEGIGNIEAVKAYVDYCHQQNYGLYDYLSVAGIFEPIFRGMK
jgi:hypothetical protein